MLKSRDQHEQEFLPITRQSFDLGHITYSLAGQFSNDTQCSGIPIREWAIKLRNTFLKSILQLVIITPCTQMDIDQIGPRWCDRSHDKLLQVVARKLMLAHGLRRPVSQHMRLHGIYNVGGLSTWPDQ